MGGWLSKCRDQFNKTSTSVAIDSDIGNSSYARNLECVHQTLTKCLIENKTFLQQKLLVKLHVTLGAKLSNTVKPTNVTVLECLACAFSSIYGMIDDSLYYMIRIP